MADPILNATVRIDVSDVAKLGDALQALTTSLGASSEQFITTGTSARALAEAAVGAASTFNSMNPAIQTQVATVSQLKTALAELAAQIKESEEIISDEGGIEEVNVSIKERYNNEVTAQITLTKLLSQAQAALKESVVTLVASEQAAAIAAQEKALADARSAAVMEDAAAVQTAAGEGMVGAELESAAAAERTGAAVAEEAAVVRTAAETMVASMTSVNEAFVALNPSVSTATKNVLDLEARAAAAAGAIGETRESLSSATAGSAEYDSLVIKLNADLTTQAQVTRDLSVARQQQKEALSDAFTYQQTLNDAYAEQADRVAAAEAAKQAAINATNEALMEETALGDGMVSGDAELVAAQAEVAAAAMAEAIAQQEATAARNQDTVAMNIARGSKEAIASGSLKLAAALQAEGHSAEEIISVLTNMGRSEGEIAVISEKLGLALEKVAADEDVVTVATEKAGGMMGYFVGRAGAAELGLGQLGFVFGRLGAAAKGLGAVFEFLGPILIAGLVIDEVEKGITTWEKWQHTVEEAARQGQEFADQSADETDKLRLQNAELDQAISKLEGHPGNGLAVAFEQLRVESDGLAKSLTEDIAKIDELFTKNTIGWFQGVITGMEKTTDLGDKYRGSLNAITAAVREQNAAVRAVPLSEGIEGQEKAAAAHAQKVVDAYKNMGTQIEQELGDIQKKINDQVATQSAGPAALGRLTPEAARAEATREWSGRVQELTNALDGLHAAEDRAALQGGLFSKTGEKDKLEAGKSIDEAAKKAQEAERSAGSAQLRIAEENLDAIKAAHEMSKADEANYWRLLAGAATAGSTLYIGAIDRANKAEIAMDAEIRKTHGEAMVQAINEMEAAQRQLVAASQETGTSAPADVTAAQAANVHAAQELAIAEMVSDGQKWVDARKSLDDTFIKQLDVDNAAKLQQYEIDEKNSIHDIEMQKKLADIKISGQKGTLSETDPGIFAKEMLLAKTVQLAAAEHTASLQEITDERQALQIEEQRIRTIPGLGAEYKRVAEQIHEADDKIVIEQAAWVQKLMDDMKKLQEHPDIEAGPIADAVNLQAQKNEYDQINTEIQKMNTSLQQQTAIVGLLKAVQAGGGVLSPQEIAQMHTAEQAVKMLTDDLKQLSVEQKKVQTEMNNSWNNIKLTIANAAETGLNTFNQNIDKMLTTTQSFSKTMINVWNSMALQIINNVLKKLETSFIEMATQQIASATAGATGAATAQKSGEAITQLAHAKSAAAGAYSALASIPIVGPALGAAAAAAVFAAALAFQQGGIVPADNTVSILHAQEMVLPKNISTGLQSMISSNSSSTSTNSQINMENHFHKTGDLTEGAIARTVVKGVKRGSIALRR